MGLWSIGFPHREAFQNIPLQHCSPSGRCGKVDKVHMTIEMLHTSGEIEKIIEFEMNWWVRE